MTATAPLNQVNIAKAKESPDLVATNSKPFQTLSSATKLTKLISPIMLTRLPLRRITTTTTTAAASTHRHASNFGAAPGPLKLPAKEQAEFERLQRVAAVSSAFQPTEAAAAAAAAPPENTTRATSTTGASSAVESEFNEGGGLYRGARPEFDGDKNPRTGEVGGPKNEPLRWGSSGDWSYNGKVTDF